jgi:hypothetical protein
MVVFPDDWGAEQCIQCQFEKKRRQRVAVVICSNRPSPRVRWFVLIVAFALHAPGLWLFFRRTVPVAVRRENLVAALGTLTSMAATAWFADDWLWVVLVWLVGHFSWGARLAWHLRQDVPARGAPLTDSDDEPS